MAGTESTEAADLEAGYSDIPTETPEVKEPVEQAKTEAEEKTEPTVTPAPTPAPFDAQAEFRKLHDTMQGRIGDLNRQLQQALKGKEEAEKPAPEAPARLKRMKGEYPELSEHLIPDIEEIVSELTGKAPDPKQLQELIDKGVAQRVEAQMANLLAAAVTDRHESWKTDLWVNGELGKDRTPEYQAWLKTMPEAEGKAFEASANPYLVNRRLDQFYEWKKAQAKPTPEPQRSVSTRQKRLEAAVTPRGTGGHASGGSTELDEMEAGYSG